MPLLKDALGFDAPDAGFYLWAHVSGYDDVSFAKALFSERHVTVLPGSFLAREANRINPGRGFIRIALVDGLNECVEAAARIADFVKAKH